MEVGGEAHVFRFADRAGDGAVGNEKPPAGVGLAAEVEFFTSGSDPWIHLVGLGVDFALDIEGGWEDRFPMRVFLKQRQDAADLCLQQSIHQNG